MPQKSILLLFAIVFLAFQSFSQTDIPTTTPAPYNYDAQKIYKDIVVETHYITMRDGVKIAVDVYLPKGFKEGDKFPTLMHQTRYWRAPELRFPFKYFSEGLIGNMGKAIKEFVYAGYVIVNVDARGSGASFGNRPYPWHENEIKDGAEIADWIIKQDWSNQIIGSIGASYSGTTANFLLVNNHPNVKAIIDLYSLHDVYRDISFPGGIYHKNFVQNWGFYNDKLDKDIIPKKNLLAKVLVKGVRRVDGPKKNKTFKAAQKDHLLNLQVSETSKGLNFRDDAPPNGIISSSDDFSPHSFVNEINNSGAAIYCYSGWFDGAYQYATIRKFLNLNNPKNKLTIGPWEHGGSFNCSPENPCKAAFSHVGEFMKFFDYHLKGIENGLYDEPRIHYFTMGEEVWKSGETWPPKAEKIKFYFDEDNALNLTPPTGNLAFDTYEVDTTVGTGHYSRWVSLLGDLKTENVYPDRKERDEKLLLYETPSLEENVEIGGHAMIKLFVKTNSPDGNFHVYLEEVDSVGNVKHISEGLIRGIHPIVDDSDAPYKDVVPYRSYLKTDTKALDTTAVSEIYFDILPTSYLFKKGSKIRIALAGADQDHFMVMHKSSPIWEVQRNKSFPSYIELPVVR